MGRRHADDERQIKRWRAEVAANTNRFRQLTRELHGLEEVVAVYRRYQEVAGGLEREIKIAIDPLRAASVGLNPDAVVSAIYQENLQERCTYAG